MKKFVAAGALLLTAMVAAGCGPSNSVDQASKSITIGYVDWPEDVAVSHVWQQILQKKGYKVHLVMAGVAPTYEGVGSGSDNLFMDAWLPHDQGTYWNRVKSTAVKVNSWYTSPTKEGFVVPDYVTINSISQLKSHASEFGNQIIGIDAGAGEMRWARSRLKNMDSLRSS